MLDLTCVYAHIYIYHSIYEMDLDSSPQVFFFFFSKYSGSEIIIFDFVSTAYVIVAQDCGAIADENNSTHPTILDSHIKRKASNFERERMNQLRRLRC